MRSSMNRALLLLAAMVGMGQWTTISAQSVIFPQQDQPGTAVASQSGGTYTLSNDLLSASFIQADGKLTFAGCDAMYLATTSELFKVTLGDGTVVPASAMTLGEVKLQSLTGDADAVKGSEKLNGQELVANYTYGNLSLVWRAVLRDGSHYLRTELDITANADQAMTSITPMLYAYDTELGGTAPAIIGNTRGAVLANDKIFAGLETPMGINSVETETSGTTTNIGSDSWTTSYSKKFGWTGSGFGYIYTYTDTWTSVTSIPSGINATTVKMRSKSVTISESGLLAVTLDYTSNSSGTSGSNNKLNTVGVDVVDASGNVVASDYHVGSTGDDDINNVYRMEVSEPGTYTVRYYADVSREIITCNGTATFDFTNGTTNYTLQGLWSRATTLESGKTWNVSAVVGLVAPGQQRRSFLAYSERERAVPWRPYPLYNSWYELNIDRNNASNPANNMQATDCISVVEDWKSKLYDQYGVAPEVFVWDDGWDDYQTWDFHSNFPNGFKDIAAITNQMGAHQGAWLGPVGGYGVSGETRRSNWSSKGGMKLSNPTYYECFLTAVTNLVNNHDVRFFKFDGISTLSSATGPDDEEDAEGIINIEREARKIREDLFINTTVGTWASPFWYRFTDATWRQENDYGTIGNGSTDREKWITYRDRLVYQNYVQNSPLCPINTLMTHGVILTENGEVATNFDYDGVLREIRCAFACGSGMVELYCDREKLDDINSGALWGDIADCIKWQRENADVLPDIHWVGGNPWDGSNNNVYGWASWNGEKATLALRNPCTTSKTFTFTLREVLEIPDYFTTALTLTKAFDKDADLTGLTTGEALDLDQQITVTLAASSVYVYDGKHDNPEPDPEPEDPTLSVTVGEYGWDNVYTGSTYEVGVTVKGENLTGDITVTSDNEAVTLSATTISKEDGMSEDGYVVKVTLSPTEVGEGTANITFATEGVKESIVKTFTWTAQAPAEPVLTVSADKTAFGAVTTGESLTATVTVTAADLKGDITVSSDNDVLTPAVSSIAQADAEAGYDLTVTLEPTVDGDGEATLTFTTEGVESQTLTFTWTAQTPAEPVLAVSTDKTALGEVTTGKTYTYTVTVTAADLSGDITVSSDNDILTPAVSSIAQADAEAGYDLTVTLAPTVAGDDEATLTFTTEGAEPQTLTFTWTAKAPTTFEEATRTVKVTSSAVYGTLILPFSHVVPSGVRAYVITSVVDGEITMKRKYVLSAFVPYILYTTTGVDTQVSGKFLASQREKYDNVYYADDYYMGGVLFDDTRYTFGAGESVLQSKNGGVAKFYNAEGMTFNVPAGKCFLKIPEEASAPSYRFVVDGETGIVLPSIEMETPVEVIYNLQGQRVFETQPGNIYIINGKKVFVK